MNSIRTLLLITLCFIAIGAFSILKNSQEKVILGGELSQTGSCSNERVKAVNASIEQCESFGVTISSQCIQNYLASNLKQKWNVIVEDPENCDAKQSFWTYDDCSIRYNKFGSFKRNFIIWKATGNPTLNSEKQISIGLDDEECSSNRLGAAQNAIYYCQFVDMLQQVSCIRNNLKSKLGEKWNAIASEPDQGKYAARYEYFDGCTLKLSNVSHHKRTYLVWKAQ